MLTDFENSFTYSLPHLEHVATLPCETQYTNITDRTDNGTVA